MLRLCDDERRFAVFKRMVTSDNAIIGQAALHGIAIIDPLPIINFLIQSLPHMHHMVLPHCIQLLGKHYDADVRALLLHYLQTTNEPVIKYTIINILGDVNDKKSIPIIEAHLQDENHHVRSYSEAALTNLRKI